jgi:tagatose 6-phosphate kinase
VAEQLGAKVRLLTVAGGHWGRLLEQSLREEGFNSQIIRVRSETRICQTLLATGFATTELVEETRPLTKREVGRVLSHFARDVRRARLVVLSGTVPPGCGDDFYARLIREANRRSIPVLIDTQRAQLLNAVKERPFLVKINRDELGAAVGMSCDSVAGLRRAARRLAGLGAQRIVLTHGAEGVYAFEDSLLKGAAFRPPRVEARNPIGSGDAMLAGVACGLWRGETFLEALRMGIACGSANAMTREPGCVRLGDVCALLKRIR